MPILHYYSKLAIVALRLAVYICECRWLDKLGIAALLGHKRVFRQDFIGASYGLLDKNQDPLPVNPFSSHCHNYYYSGLEGLLALFTVQEVGRN